MVITDSQVHLWEAHRTDRPWSAEYVNEKVFVAMPGARAHREEPLEAPEWIATMDAAGVDPRGVRRPIRWRRAWVIRREFSPSERRSQTIKENGRSRTP